jgi:phage shock protein A
MSWLERIGQVIRANLTSLAREAEDPEKMLEEAVGAIEQELIEMRRALAEAIATHKSTERQLANHQIAAQKWYERAQLALEKENEAIAREALVNRQSYQTIAQRLQAQLEQQSSLIAKVKQDLRSLEHKYAELRAQKSLYVARLRSATASQKIQEIAGNLNLEGSSALFEKIEAKILELEAQSDLMQEIAGADPLEKKFAALEGSDHVEAELANLKAQHLHPANPSEAS